MSSPSSASRQSLVVEFVGLPGAGKSMVCAALTGLFSEKPGAVWTRDTREEIFMRHVLEGGRLTNWAANGLYLARNLRMPATLLRYARSFRPSHHKALPLFTKRLLRKVFVHSHPPAIDGIVLLDQGILQDIWSLSFVRRPTVRTYPLGVKLVQLVSKLLPDIVVFVETPPSLVQERLRQRYAREGNLGLNEAVLRNPDNMALIAHELELGEKLVACAQSLGAHVLRSDGTLPPDLQAKKLFAQIHDIQRCHQD